MSDDSDGKNPQEEREGHYPPVSFSTLLFTFSSQAAVHLGLLENPLTGKRETDIAGARHFIDTLDLPADAKARLLALTPASYVGLAERLAREI